VVYAIQSFGNAGLPDLGTVFVDDASLTVVPEPATLALAAVSGLGLLAVHRRRR
jgi:MYXO-CTERM domain-containing protein